MSPEKLVRRTLSTNVELEPAIAELFSSIAGSDHQTRIQFTLIGRDKVLELDVKASTLQGYITTKCTARVSEVSSFKPEN